MGRAKTGDRTTGDNVHLSPLNRRTSLAGRLVVALTLVAAVLIAVPGSTQDAGAQTGVCPTGTTLGTTSWGTGTPGGMIWDNTVANGLSGANQTYADVAGLVDLTLSYTDPDNVNEDLDNPYLNFVTGDSWDGPVYTETNGVYGADFFTIVMNSLNSTQTVDWSFGFTKPVFVPDFTVSDVDWAGYGYNTSGIGTPHESFQDEVVLAGQRGGNAIATTATGGSGITDLGNGQLVAGPYVSGVNGNVGPTDAAGTVALSTVGPVTSFNMQYSNGPDDATADALDGSPPAPIPANSAGVSNNHAVAISNFTICAGDLRFGDLVWADIDGDGIRDASEPGLPGVLVTISDPDGNVIETQTTDANGNYEFEQFPGFTWVVSIDPPAGYTATYDRDGGDLISTAINPTTNEFDIDFGLQPAPGTISGSVFTDRNNNGQLNPAQQEVALPGVTVALTGQDIAGNTVTATTTTAADGSYTFIDVPAGVYQVSETQPTAGFLDGQDTPGTNAVANGNDQHEVTLGQLESSTGNDFAEVPTSSISGTVYEDADDDATIDTGETGISNVAITIAGIDVFGNSVSFTATTGADGTYTVPLLVSGTYTVTETAQPAGFADGQESVGSAGGTIGLDTFTGVPLGFDDDATDYDFGEIPVSAISGRVTDEVGDPIVAVAIGLTGTDDLGASVILTTTTATDGTYSFIDLRPGTYTVTETQPPDYGDGLDSVGTIDGTEVGTLGNDVITDVVIIVGDNGVDYDFTETLGSIAGSVVDDGGGPIAGVTITLTGTDANGQAVSASTTTAADGSYLFDNLVGGTYTVTETQPAGYGDGGETAGTAGGTDTANDQVSAIALAGGVDATGYDFDETRSSLSGQVFVDPENDGVFGAADTPEAGVTITLVGTDIFGATISRSTTTAPDGTYTFDNLIEGTYQIDETQPGGLVDGIDTAGTEGGNTTVNDRFSAISLGAGVDGTDYDFAELPPAGITGSVTDSNGDPISGVALALSGTSSFGAIITQATTSAADGSYSFFDLPPGTYTVTETQPTGYGDGLDSVGTVGGAAVGTLGNDIISDIVLSTDSIGVDYDFTETFASIAGTVVDDDGTGIAGATITLTGLNDLGSAISETATTATNGTYSFNSLFSGTYTVTETQPSAYGDGGETAGTAAGDASVNDVISTIALVGGVSATGYDFDETRGSLRGRVYEDVNNNGTRQGTEPSIGGVTITLTGIDGLGATVSETTTTATNGTYRFNDLLAGDYTIVETQPAGYADGIDRAGAVGGDISVNDEISAITLAGGQIANGYLFGEILPSSISGTVFLDDNDNGTQNTGDVGINGVDVELSGTDDLGATVAATTMTAADGSYSFTGLRPGTYTITETQPTGYLDGKDSAGSISGVAVGDATTDDVITAIALPTNTAAAGYNFAELESASIRGTVIDDGGNPIESVTITLAGTNDLGASVAATTTTAADGSYSFTGLRPGTYTVTETQPSAYGDGGEAAGSVGGDDSSVNDQISGIVVPVATDVTGYDFDETRGSIAGLVFEDTNNDGIRNGSEIGILGVSVRLTGVDATGSLIDLLITTAADGSYLFEPLLAGTYTVTETHPSAYLDGIDAAGTAGGTTTTNDEINSITLPGGADSAANNFGELVASSITGTVVDDAGTGIGGVVITLSGNDDLGASVSSSATTAVDGTYSFSGLRPGTYTITETQPAAYLDGGETAGTIAGVSVGDDSLDDVVSAVFLPSDTGAAGYDFDEIRASSIRGTVVDDAGTGIAGVSITLTGTDDLGTTVSLAATTAVDGTYGFVGLRPGTYTVTETQPAAYGDGANVAGSVGGDTATTNDQVAAIGLPANTDATGYDFDETRGSITSLVYEDTNNSGTRDAGEAALGGVTVELNGTDVLGNVVSLTATTLSNGIARFNDLLAGDYEVIETQPAGYLDGIDTAGSAGGDTAINDTIATINLVGGVNATNYRFGELVASSVNGTVFDDDSGDGSQQSGEAGIGSVTVDLSGTDDLGAAVTASATTAPDGSYSFNGLRPGTYAVTETQPPGFLDGIDTAGTIAAVVVGDASVDDVISAIVLPSDTAAIDYDFAEMGASSIAGSVVDDDGIGIAGVTITLTGIDDLGATISLTTATAADGSYSFTNLRPGAYTVTETQPAAYGDGGETAGTTGGTVSDDVVSSIALGAEEDATGYDFDETRGSIAGLVYEDLDGNGVQNGTEPGISGAAVELTGADVLGTTVTLNATTGANGIYSFGDLLAGSYSVTETQPTGYADGQETIGSSGGTNATNDEIAAIALTGGVDATSYDFGEVQAASIAGTVVDDGGNGIENVTITLTGTDDLGATVSATTTTAADGTYTFTGLRPGTYAVAETQPSAYGDGGQNAGTAGGDNTTTNDRISSIALESGEDATGYNFDETRGSVAGIVYEDTNNNGTQNTGETGISGATIELTGTNALGATINLSTTTATNGTYTFDDLLTGTYTITETQPTGYLDGIDTAGTSGGTVNPDEIASIALAAGVDAAGYNFGELAPSSISGAVVDDLSAPIAGVALGLTGTDDLGAAITLTTTTAVNGTYSFDDLRPGTYTVTETQPTGYLDGGETAGTIAGLSVGNVTDDAVSTITLSSDADAIGYDFDEIVASSISGTVIDDASTGIENVTITLTGIDDRGATVTATATSISDGSYSFTNLRPGTYTVTETQPAAYGDGNEASGTAGGDDTVDDVVSGITLPARTNATGYDFDETRGSIAGLVYEDLDGNGVQNGTEPGISGAAVELTGADVLGTTVTLNATTGANGIYSFGDLLAGSYSVTETQPTGYADGQETIGSSGGTNATNDEIAAIALTGGVDATSYDFGEVQAASIAGTVVDDGGNGIENVTITLTGTDDLGATVSATTTTAADGTYTFTGLRPGTYAVAETQPSAYGDGGQNAGTAGGDNTTTNDRISSIALESGEDATGYNFDETRGSVAGIVYEDTNNNGTQNTGETGIANTLVRLTGVDANATAISLTTTTNSTGGFVFTALLAGTYRITETQPAGFADGIDTLGTAGGTLANDLVTAINLTGGAAATSYTFGEIQLSSIAGTVVDDATTGIAGVTITLTGTDDLGAIINLTTTTASNGTYTFTGLRPGTYTVTETQPTGYLDGGETAGTIAGLTVGNVTNDAVSAITLPTNTSATGYDFDELRASSIAGTVVDDATTGIAGVTITLTGTDDLGATVNLTDTTNVTGLYSFDGLRPGTYTVTETQPAAYGDGGETAGTIAGTTVGTTTDDQISAITLPSNTNGTDYDFDETRGSIAGLVFEDTSNNGARDGVEPGISGVTVTLTGTDILGTTVTLSTTTATNGSYSFGDLLAGSYAVAETQAIGYLDGIDTLGTAGGTLANDLITAINLTGGANAADYQFGELLASSIAGNVVDDAGTGIAGVTITLTGTDDLGATVATTAATIANGSYAFPALRPGTYTVTETQPAGYLDGGETAGTIAGLTVGNVTNDAVSAITLPTNTSATGYDFDELRASSIAGTVVDDATTGIAGVTITLTGTDDLGATVNLTDTTNVTGLYSFDGLRPGTYTVTETQPAAYGDGGETAGTEGGIVGDDDIAAIALAANTTASGYDFDEARGSIAGAVYEDLDGNGVQNGTEPGISGVAVALTGIEILGTTVNLSTTTGTDGSYGFAELLAGTYTVTETQPAGYLDAQETIGSAGGTTSANDQISVTLIGGVNAAGYDFGEVQTASIAGTVFIDSDNSGTQNGAEVGIDAVVITLTGADDLGATVNLTDTTAIDGSYAFPGLRPGTYTVTETQPVGLSDGLDQVGSDGGTLGNDVVSDITLGSAVDATGYDFGELEGASISGTVVDSAGDGIANATLTLSGTDDLGATIAVSTTTASNGTYTFISLRPGTYTVTETQPTGYGDGGEAAGTAGGAVTDDSVAAITLGSGQSVTGYDFDEVRASISGSVYLDANGNGVRDASEAGLPGVPIELTGTNDLGATIDLSTTTVAGGAFSFDDLLSGTYTVTEIAQPIGLVDGLEAAGTSGGVAGNTAATNDAITAITLGPGADAIDYVFGEWDTSAIGGTVVDELGNPIPGVTLTLNGAEDDGGALLLTATTGPTGVYTFTGLEPGAYTITEAQPTAYGDGSESVGTVDGTTTGTATNDQIAGIVIGPNSSGVDYDFIETLGSVSGTVFEDTNGNGTLETEPGIDNVTVTLTGADANGATVNIATTTGTNGSYTFDDVVGGTYTITQTQPAGYLDGAETIGSAGGSATTNDVINGITTAGGAHEIGYDFGEIDAASISGSVVDDGGTPIVGATITLTGTDDLGATVNLTDTTNVTGVYSFDGLRPGTYTVTETQPLGYGDGGETAGPFGGTVTDDQVAGIALGPDTDADGNDFDEVRSTISGRVFEDLDSSGSATAGESGINGTTITLTGTDVFGAVVTQTTTTSGDGNFSFTGLIAGTYTIIESQPVAFADGDDTVGSAGGNGTTQNDTVSAIVLGAGVVESGYLFGEVAPVAVAGRVFIDSDNDGSSIGEIGIAGVTISLSGLDDRGQLVNDSTITATNGSYAFTGLRPGVYTVSETQPGGFLDGLDTVGVVAINPNPGTITGSLGIDQITGVGMTSGQSGSGYNFGELAPSSISGSVLDDLGRPIAGVTIVLTGTDDLGATVALSAATATNGSYTFSGLRPGTYTVDETQPAAYGDGGEAAGTIDGSTVGSSSDDQISTIVLGAGSDGIDYDFDETTASISGQVFVDNDGDTMPSTGDADLGGVAIQLIGIDVNGQSVAAAATTAANGGYAFDGLLAGTYSITETQPAGFLDAIDTPGTAGGSADNSVGGDQISAVAIAAGSSSTANNFSEVETGSLSGSVADDGGNGIAGVTITLTGTDMFGQTVNLAITTAANGSYSFTALAPGTYSITETQPVAYGDGGESVGTIDGTTTGAAADDALNAITLLSGQDGIGYDFDETRMSITGTVVIDVDNDGIADAGELPIAGVTITLTGTDNLGATVTATTTTAADGTYVFGGLLAGAYAIAETQPGGFLDGAETAGSSGGTVASDSISGIAVIPGADATDYDFGELEPATLSGSVVDDLGRPISGVTLTLTGIDDLGSTVTATTATAAGTGTTAGAFTFNDLRPGIYTITETQPLGYGDGGQTAGSIAGVSVGTVADDQTSAIVVGSGSIGSGYDFDETTSSLAGSVVHATAGGDGPISGVTIEVSGVDANGDVVAASTTTAADGTYTFDGLLAGDYTITETQPTVFADGPERIGTAGGDVTTNDVITAIPLGDGVDAIGYDFTETATVLTGQVRIDRSGDGVPDPTDDLDLSGIVIELLSPGGTVVATTTTAVDGSYAIGGLIAGDYTVRQTQPIEWGSISPDDLPISLPVTGMSNVNFIEQAGSISGTVFADDDTNGLDDQTTPQSGVTVTLSDASGVIATAITGTDGNYTFIGLPAADYTVTVATTVDTTFTVRDAGTDDGVDSDVDPLTGSVGVTLPAGSDVTDIDAGTVDLVQDLAINITTTATGVNVGDEVPFNTTVTNAGNTTISGGVTVTIPIPANTIFVSASGQGWTITVTDGILTATRPDTLASGDTTPPITLIVEPTQAGSISVTGEVVSSTGLVETTTSNNVSSVPVTVTATTTTNIPNLAYTGSSIVLLLLIAAGLLFSGRTLMFIGGPRRKDDD